MVWRCQHNTELYIFRVAVRHAVDVLPMWSTQHSTVLQGVISPPRPPPKSLGGHSQPLRQRNILGRHQDQVVIRPAKRGKSSGTVRILRIQKGQSVIVPCGTVNVLVKSGRALSRLVWLKSPVFAKNAAGSRLDGVHVHGVNNGGRELPRQIIRTHPHGSCWGYRSAASHTHTWSGLHHLSFTYTSTPATSSSRSVWRLCPRFAQRHQLIA